MIRTLFCSGQDELPSELSVQDIPAALQDSGGMLWVDIQEEDPAHVEMLLREIFKFHPLAIDDALHEMHIPKIDDWGDYVYLVLHAVEADSRGEDFLVSLELDLFVGPNYMISYHDRPVPALERVWTAFRAEVRLLRRGSSHLLYRLADELVVSFIPALDQLEDDIDGIEDQIFDNPTTATLEQTFALKRALLRLRRYLLPQRDVLIRLGREDFAAIDPQYKVYYRDVYDHVARLSDLSESRRELVSSAMDTYLSVINNRLNDVMKTLTVFTALFMPLSFLTGFFGMNFFQPALDLAPWTGQLAFGLTLLAVLATPLGMLFWMRRRGWM
jgi:magnesium transporter